MLFGGKIISGCIVLKTGEQEMHHLLRYEGVRRKFNKKRKKLILAAVGGHCNAMSSMVVTAWGAAGDEAEYASSSLSSGTFVRQKLNKK